MNQAPEVLAPQLQEAVRVLQMACVSAVASAAPSVLRLCDDDWGKFDVAATAALHAVAWSMLAKASPDEDTFVRRMREIAPEEILRQRYRKVHARLNSGRPMAS